MNVTVATLLMTVPAGVAAPALEWSREVNARMKANKKMSANEKRGAVPDPGRTKRVRAMLASGAALYFRNRPRIN
jgi:hypothetical protein